MHTPDTPDRDADATDISGRVLLGRFRVERVLGRGGMGEVLLAYDTLFQNRVALKHLRADGPQAADRRNALVQEARRARRVSDHRIAAIHDLLDLGDDVLLVMEYVDGVTLRERLREPFALESFWKLSGECLGGLGAAHAHGVIHRDIKPENLMLTNGQEIKILDFGLALRSERHHWSAGPDDSTSRSEQDPRPAGTPRYMAPEAYVGGHIDERTDIFSLGAVFYEMLTARHPFEGGGFDSILDHILNSAPTPASQVNAAVPEPLSRVIDRMLAREPVRRYASCEEVATALASARAQSDGMQLVGRPVVTPTARTVPMPGRRTAWVRDRRLALGLALLAVVAVVAWRLLAPPPVPRERNIALLRPTSVTTSREFTAFADGSVEILAERLRRHEREPGFQIAAFSETFFDKVRSVEDSRKLLGANLALVPGLEQTGDRLLARLELREPARGRLIAASRFEVSVAEPLAFAESLYRKSASLLKLSPRGEGATAEIGVRGTGTIRFLAQGIGRLRAAESTEEFQLAREDLETACRTEPDAAVARAWLAMAELKVHRRTKGGDGLARAERSARMAIGLDDRCMEGHVALGDVLSDLRRPAEALSEYRRANELEPTQDAALLGYATAHTQLGDPAGERAVYASAVEQRPHVFRLWWLLADWEFRQAHIPEAIRAYEEVIRRAPALSRGYASLGGLLVLQGEYQRAIDTLHIAVSIRPTRTAFGNLGTAYFNTGQPEQAVDAYNKAVQFGDATYVTWLNLGDAYYWLRNRPDQARDAYLQAVRLGTEQVQARAGDRTSGSARVAASLASMFAKLEQPDSARAYLEWALSADSTNSMVQYSTALTLWQLGEHPQALSWLERAVNGGYPTAWLRDSPVHRDWRSEPRFNALLEPASPATQSTRSPATGGRR